MLRCDACGRPLKPMPPEVEARRRAEAILRGVPIEQQTKVVCDPCWEAAEARGLPFIRLKPAKGIN